ncbi:MAG: helix-turn-helix domain-containing protein [Ruminococcus sp.]
MKHLYTENLKKLRKANSYSQADIAFILGIRQEQYSKYESGVRELPIHILIKLCKIYRVSSDYILGLEKSNSPL